MDTNSNRYSWLIASVAACLIGIIFDLQPLLLAGAITLGATLVYIAFSALTNNEKSTDIVKFENKNGGKKITHQAPLRLQNEIEQLKSFDPKESKAFFEKVDALRSKASNYPALLRTIDRKERNAHIGLLALKHHSTLQRNLRNAVKMDDYGTVLEDNSAAEIIRFLDSMGYSADDEDIAEDYAVVSALLETVRNETAARGFNAESYPLGGIDFEHWVGDQLKIFGWETEVTQPGSDQGIDIVADYKGTRVGIQCKRFNSNVGNKAVQEAYAAKRLFGLDRVAVITTAGYTKSAEELGKANNVGLYTVEDIANLAELLDLA